MDEKTKLLIVNLENVYGRDPWYGDSILSILDKTKPNTILNKLSTDSHSIAELLTHVISWREFVLSKLKGDNKFNVEQNESFNWKRIDSNEKTIWKSLLDALEKNQNEIIKVLENSDDILLEKLVPGKNYNMSFLVDGIIQHDIYHLGQISFIASAFKN